MALIKCPECGKEISDKALSCPQCGYPISNDNKMLRPKDIKEIFGCSWGKAYAIINQNDFPKIKIGKQSYIPLEAFEQWKKNYTGKEYII
jgi:uncharacterized membrane protein YvbJ